LSKEIIEYKPTKTKGRDKIKSTFLPYRVALTCQLSIKLVPMLKKLESKLVNIGVTLIIIGAILQFTAIII